MAIICKVKGVPHKRIFLFFSARAGRIAKEQGKTMFCCAELRWGEAGAAVKEVFGNPGGTPGESAGGDA